MDWLIALSAALVVPQHAHRAAQLKASATPTLAVNTTAGSLVGATALVAGTTVGAGIIALPAKTLAAGFLPSTAALVGSWLYMAATGLLLAEVNLNTLCVLERDAVSLNSMAGETLGETGARASSAAFLFLHYSLLTAYILQGGTLLCELLPSVPEVWGATVFAAAVGGSIVLASQAAVETANNALVVGVVATFVALLGFGAQQVQPELLLHADVGALVPALPVLPVAYVFQTVVPTCCFLLGCDLARIRIALLAGTGLPMLMFISWSAVILGSVPYDAASAAGGTFDPLLALREAGGAFGGVLRVFSLLAVTTSLIGFSYGLTDFFADLFGMDASLDEGKERPAEQKATLYALALVPPVAIATYAITEDPSLFFSVVDNAGTYGILVIFGLLPALMAWEQRYGADAEPLVEDAVPGGRAGLAAIAGGAAAVIGLETWEKVAGWAG